MANQFDEQSWEAQQEDAKRIMAEQTEALAQEKQLSASEADNAEAEAQSPEDLDRERGYRFRNAMTEAREQAQLNPNIQDEVSNSEELARLDEEIKVLKSKASGSWQVTYFFLTIGAAITDLLQILTDATVLLAILSSLVGLIYSAIRYIVLRFEARKNKDSRYEKDMVARTLVSGAISLIPGANLLPEHTGAMMLETAMRKKIMMEAEQKLTAKKLERQNLASQSN